MRTIERNSESELEQKLLTRAAGIKALKRTFISQDQMIGIYGQERINVGYHPAKFGGLRHCGSRYMILVCHVNLHDRVIKGSCDFMVRSPSK